MLRLYLLMLGANLRAQMQYKLNFVAAILGLWLSYGAQFINLNIMINQFGDLNGWQTEEVIFLLALAIMAWGFCVSLFWVFIEVGEVMIRGEFDRFLLRPANPFLLYAGTQGPLNAAGQLLFSIAALIYVAVRLQIQLSFIKWVYLFLTIIGGGLILGSAMIAVGAAAFWVTRSQGLYWSVVFPARQLAWYPIDIYRVPLQVILTFAIPFAFINYYPAQYLLDRSGPVLFTPLFAFITPLVGVLCFAGAYGLWNLGLRRYAGTGS